jgi:hypothetical protein
MKKLMKIKSMLLLINIMFFNVFTAVAQQDYLAYNAAEKSVLFSDEFNDNAKEWITDNLWIKGAISGGYYSITCKNYQMSTGLSYQPILIDPNVDFGIETEIKIIKGTGALVFGMIDNTFDHYRVEISDNNTLEVLKNTPSKKKKVENLFTGTGSLPVTRELNKVTVVRIQGVFYIYVNESFVNQFSNIKLEGNLIGFNVGTESEISVDYLKVTEFKSKAAPLLAEKVQTPQNVAAETVKPPSPVITWINPLKGSTTLKSTNSSVRASVRSASGLQGVVLYLNGVAYGQPEMTPSATETGVYIVEKAINFDAGENNIYLEASNQGGTSTSEKRYFTTPTPPAPVTAQSNQVAPQTDASRGNTAPAATVITWTSPSGANTTLESFNATVKATIKSTSGLKSVLLYMTGISKGEPDVKLAPDEAGTFQVEKNLNFGPGENQIYLVVTNSDGATTKSDLRYFTNPFAVAPVVTWSNPSTPNTLVSTENYTIEVSIKSPTDLKSAKLTVNGEMQFEDNVFQPSGTDNTLYIWQPSVILKKGENSIYISATNIAGTKRSEQRVIKYEASLAEKRIALVFGNSQYKVGNPLKNPMYDANLMEVTLKELGFDVIKRLNATKAEMEAAIREFTEKLPQYNVTLF